MVIDELDALKDSGRNRVRWRAGYSLAVVEDRLRSGPVGTVRSSEDNSPRSHKAEVSVEVLFDPPGHVRLPISDDELVDRALAAQWLSYQQDLIFITYDTGQAMRARTAGIREVRRLRRAEDEPGEGPEPDG